MTNANSWKRLRRVDLARFGFWKKAASPPPTKATGFTIAGLALMLIGLAAMSWGAFSNESRSTGQCSFAGHRWLGCPGHGGLSGDYRDRPQIECRAACPGLHRAANHPADLGTRLHSYPPSPQNRAIPTRPHWPPPNPPATRPPATSVAAFAGRFSPPIGRATLLKHTPRPCPPANFRHARRHVDITYTSAELPFKAWIASPPGKTPCPVGFPARWIFPRHRRWDTGTKIRRMPGSR